MWPMGFAAGGAADALAYPIRKVTVRPRPAQSHREDVLGWRWGLPRLGGLDGGAGGDADRLRASRDIEFGEDRGDVVAHRLRREEEPVSDLDVAETCYEQVQHLSLAWGETGRVGASCGSRSTHDRWQVAHAKRTQAADGERDGWTRAKLLEGDDAVADRIGITTLGEDARGFVGAANCSPADRGSCPIASDLQCIRFGNTVDWPRIDPHLLKQAGGLSFLPAVATVQNDGVELLCHRKGTLPIGLKQGRLGASGVDGAKDVDRTRVLSQQQRAIERDGGFVIAATGPNLTEGRQGRNPNPWRQPRLEEQMP